MTTSTRMPVVFFPHGGGPWPFVDIGMDKAEFASLTQYLESLRDVPSVTPKAIVVVSAHWEASVPTVMTALHPPLLFDYYGFPESAYELQWPAPGHPQVAARALELLGAAGFATSSDESRGFDHGTFVPLKLAYPNADVPTVQLSLKTGLDPLEHLAIGRALAPLRDEGVFVVGSGMTFHNMRAFKNAQGREISETFDAWLQETALKPAKERDALLAQWSTAPAARLAHPREEHLLPLMVIAGAAGEDVGSVAFAGKVLGTQVSGYRFG